MAALQPWRRSAAAALHNSAVAAQFRPPKQLVSNNGQRRLSGVQVKANRPTVSTGKQEINNKLQ